MFDNQKTFNIVVRHLRKQGKQAIVKDGVGNNCRYRTPEGLKCAAGCLIPDKKYRPSMEGEACFSERIANVLIKHNHDPAFVAQLQGIHDNTPVDKWEKDFVQVATLYNLTVPDKETDHA